MNFSAYEHWCRGKSIDELEELMRSLHHDREISSYHLSNGKEKYRCDVDEATHKIQIVSEVLREK